MRRDESVEDQDLSREVVRVLAVGDIVGRPGRRLVKQWLEPLREALRIDLVVANVENAAGGFGMTPETYDELCQSGVDLMTSGNHIYDKRGCEHWMDDADRLVRPANFPPGSPGRSVLVELTSTGHRVAIINLIGRVFMKHYDCPFRAVDGVLDELPRDVDFVLVDMHAEATSEKMAMGWYLAGRVAALWGTHTHVPTADARLLENSTGYLTDLGMTGAYDSVIGMKKEAVVEGFLSLLKTPFEVAKGDPRIGMCVFSVAAKSGKCVGVEPYFMSPDQLHEICHRGKSQD